MHRATILIGGICLACGVAIGLAAAPRSGAEHFMGKPPREAALALASVAEGQAGKGSWESIGVARLYMLMGEKGKADEILTRVQAGKLKQSDWMRMGRLYREAGDWERATAAFDKALALDPKDAEYAAEVGAFHNLRGERARAEELFERSFKLSSDSVWNTLNVAGSYVGVSPQ